MDSLVPQGSFVSQLNLQLIEVDENLLKLNETQLCFTQGRGETWLLKLMTKFASRERSRVLSNLETNPSRKKNKMLII